MKLDALCQQGGLRQGGAAAVEFALVAVLLIVLLLGIVELGRFLYLFNTVQEVTRRAAREAVVRDFTTAEQGKIKRAAVLQDEGGSGKVSLPAGGEITNGVVNIEYLNVNQVPVTKMPDNPGDNISACSDSTRVSECIRYVQVRVCVPKGNKCDPVQYMPWIGLFVPNPDNPTRMQWINLGIDIPGSTVIMPAESLGYTFTL